MSNIYRDISTRTAGDIYIGVVGPVRTGKSTFINKVAGRKTAKTEDRPGVTRSKQWVPIDKGLELLDTPGILWPKFEDQFIAENLAATGAIRDDILDIEHLSLKLVKRLRDMYPRELATRFKLTDADGWKDLTEEKLLALIGKKRGCLIPGGFVDNERVSNLLIDEFRAGKIGKMTIDRLPETPKTISESIEKPRETLESPAEEEEKHADL